MSVMLFPTYASVTDAALPEPMLTGSQGTATEPAQTSGTTLRESRGARPQRTTQVTRRDRPDQTGPG